MEINLPLNSLSFGGESGWVRLDECLQWFIWQTSREKGNVAAGYLKRSDCCHKRLPQAQFLSLGPIASLFDINRAAFRAGTAWETILATYLRPRYEISFGRFDRLKLSRPYTAVKNIVSRILRKEKRKGKKRLWRWIAPSIRYKLSLVLSKQRYCSTINPVYEFIYFDVILERREWWCIERDKLAACKCQKCNLRKMNKPPVTIFQRRPIRVRCDRAVGSPPLEIPLSPSVNSSVSRELFRQQVPTLI